MPKKKSMGKPKDVIWLHVGENFYIIIYLLHEIKPQFFKEEKHKKEKQNDQQNLDYKNTECVRYNT
jgi:hypothetical protein